MLRPLKRLFVLAIPALATASAGAADWSDTSIGVRHGTTFREPYEPGNIVKTIVDLQHASGYKYGSNFFNVDLLMSDGNDPGGAGATSGAQEAYVVYRHFLDAGKVLGRDLAAGPVRTWGLTAGFDWNTKNDAGYNSKKRMLVLGPTAKFDVPGYLDVGIQEFWESNAPYNTYTNTPTPRYHYRAHPALAMAWGLPIGSLPLAFEGYGEFITGKGTDEFGGTTAPETHVDGEVIWDAGTLVGAQPRTWRLGVEYEFWKNKFGNNWRGPAGSGAFAHTPMVRAEYHF